MSRFVMVWLVVLGCQDEEVEVTLQQVSAVTYNVGLAPNYVSYAEERQPFVIDALLQTDADVVCLNEVWMADDIDAVLAATESVFPYEFHEYTQEEGLKEPACTDKETAPLVVCTEKYCSDTEDLVGCVFANCGDEFYAMSAECRGCAAANVDLDDVDAIVEACLSGGGTLTYGGHNGLMLLSRQPLEDTAHQEFQSWLTQRAVLSARMGDAQIACTHLASDLSEPTYESDFASSYEEEQAMQIDALLTWFDTRVGDGPGILLGDFNTGPATTTGIEAELVDNWQMLADAGWQDANLAQKQPFCTWCNDNTLTGAGVESIIDHVLVINATTDNPVRLFDEKVTIETDDGPSEVSLSDHYGVSATISFE